MRAIDQRVLDYWDAEEVSIGDYVLTGGELPAMVLIDSVARLLPDVLGNENSALEESVYSGLLEHPQYTKPREYRGLRVPEVLVKRQPQADRSVEVQTGACFLRKRGSPDMFRDFIGHGNMKSVRRTNARFLKKS